MKEELGLLLHVAAKFVGELGELRGIGLEAVEIADLEPLAAEIFDQRARFRIEQHAVDLRAEHFGIAETVLPGELEKIIVGQAAPQEIGEARGELEIVEMAGWLDAEEEARGNQDGFDGELHSFIDGVGHFDEVHEAVDFFIRNGPTICAAGEAGEIGAGASESVMAGRVTAAENAGVGF